MPTWTILAAPFAVFAGVWVVALPLLRRRERKPRGDEWAAMSRKDFGDRRSPISRADRDRLFAATNQVGGYPGGDW